MKNFHFLVKCLPDSCLRLYAETEFEAWRKKVTDTCKLKVQTFYVVFPPYIYIFYYTCRIFMELIIQMKSRTHVFKIKPLSTGLVKFLSWQGFLNAGEISLDLRKVAEESTQSGGGGDPKGNFTLLKFSQNPCSKTVCSGQDPKWRSKVQARYMYLSSDLLKVVKYEKVLFWLFAGLPCHSTYCCLLVSQFTNLGPRHRA